MQMLEFGSTGKRTSRLGFGCSSIISVGGRDKGLALLEAAFEAGVRHFDVAPMYGDGEAERLLGEFLARHRGQCTITTKFGIPPSKTQPAVKLAKAVLRPVLASLPALKRRLQTRSQSGKAAVDLPTGPNPIFNVAQAQTTLEHSLRELQVEQIDCWLMHEAKLQDLAAPAADGLLRMLEDAVAAGRIGMFGVGSDHKDLAPIEQVLPAFARVTQSEWSILSPSVDQIARIFRIHHRALSSNFALVMEELLGNAERCRAASEELGANLADEAVVARLMLKASLLANPASVVLYSSKRAGHIATNASVADDETLTEPARRFHRWFSEGKVTAGVRS